MNAHTQPTAESAPLRQTPLHALHVARRAKMVSFAGYEMPLSYAAGVMAEHLHTRAAAGLFDVSHMGQIEIRARGGDAALVAEALEALVPADILGLGPGRQRYGLLLNEAGAIRDDLMIANLGDRLLLVVNAATKSADEAVLRAALPASIEIEVSSNALVALQGPKAEGVLAKLAPDVEAMSFLDVRALTLLGAPCTVSRSGYTGEDGFEISVPNERAVEIAEALLADDAVAPIGLGARDTLRLEAGLCLYGADIDEETSPVEANLTWSIGPVRRAGGLRKGGFLGADRVLSEIETGVGRRRVGLRPEGRAPVRAGAALFADETSDAAIGKVTSGGFGPTVGAPIAMGYLPPKACDPETRVFAEVRGQRLPLRVAPLPFVPVGFKRH